MPGASPLIEARGAGVRRGGRWILHDVDLAVAAGEVVTLIGPNGAGKTTLVRVLLGLLKPDSGAVRRSATASIGYVPQRVHFDPTLPLTVERLMILTGRRPSEAVAEALEETAVGHLLGARVLGPLRRRAAARPPRPRAPAPSEPPDPGRARAGSGSHRGGRALSAHRRHRGTARLRGADGEPRPAHRNGRHGSGRVPQPPRMLHGCTGGGGRT